MSAEEEIQRPITIKRKVSFMIGELVYLKSELSQRPHIVLEYVIGTIDAPVKYSIRYADEGASDHAEIEISLTPDILMKQEANNNGEE
jgi:hypothetical protein